MEKQTPPKKKARKAKKVKEFINRMFVPNYGYVDVGDKVTKDIKEAWESWTSVPIDNYLK